MFVNASVFLWKFYFFVLVSNHEKSHGKGSLSARRDRIKSNDAQW